MSLPRPLALTTLAAAAALALTACGGSPSEPTTNAPATSPSASDSATASEPAAADSYTFDDNHGSHTVALPPKSVVALDNRTFQTLSDWGVQLSAAAVSLMPDTIAYTQDSSLVDVGAHREPNLELIVAAQPDLVVSGQRFVGYYEDIKKLVPDAAVIELDPREDQPLDAELKRQVTVLGEIFGKQAEAKQLGDDLDAAIARVKAAYDPAQTVMAVNVSGGNIGFISPDHGRTLGEMFRLLDLTPALTIEDATDDHEGDEVSVEAIAKANPAWILVMDRSAAIESDDPAFQPAAEVIGGSEALKNVDAVKSEQIVYMPNDTYINEGIQTYTEFLNSFADALEAAKQS
ncbi:siderophore ABC transporter substrate-binding protein [Tessaracoccus caeni]|uniref:siderophore ABC transporter substrate-binding protein n=1 Tax=Tessaracoccus caeni TaxID=3031239 RepID=UPI0023DC4C4A|nr:ABC transporter substrate-binding protein [Tessaracoccus caeni]MDF1489085.1 ABC transporter substrate-binding protein [Tessaracoccus caeni]